MVYLSKIYTKSGDRGDTGLGDGSRVRKDHARVAAYGAVDELNAVLGLLLAQGPDVPEGDWFKDFASFKICGRGSLPKTFLLRGQAAKGEAL